ncbi:MAG TPA: DNA alkylation repair protein [Actinomycetota bacterium]|nr:DNA alkylation repair protein [Actinomycetota bacterium]
MSVKKLIGLLRRGLSEAADPARAPKMQAYMKSAMPYYGVGAPVQRRVCKPLFDEHRFTNQSDWMNAALELWRDAKFREERYAAIELTGHRFYEDFQDMSALPMYEEMVVDGAWWDYVDAVAVHRIGKKLLVRHPPEIKRLMRKWSRSSDLWKRRTSIICQVALKEKTDLALLYGTIESNLDHKDFFIRKAIGWGLRSYAWVDPEEVRRYVGEHSKSLSPLSRREATKNI